MAANECLKVTVVDTVILEDTLGGLVFLSFLLSLLFGIVIGALIMRCIFREMEDHNTRRKDKSYSLPVIIESSDQANKSPSMTKKMGSNRIYPALEPGDKSGKNVTIEMEPTYSLSSQQSLSVSINTQKSKGHCFADALIQTTGESIDVELQYQDFRMIEKMEDDLRKEKSETFLQLIKMILSFLLSKTRIDETFRRKAIAKYEQTIEDIETDSQRQQVQDEQELRETITDQKELDNKLEELNSKISKRKDSRLIELQEEFGKDLTKESDLSEDEAKQILSKLMANFTAAEKRRVDELNRQSMVLHERLARRQLIAQRLTAEKQEEKDEYEERKTSPNNIISVLKKRGKLTDDQSQSILDEYKQDMRILEEKHQQAVLKHEADLAAKLRKKREQKQKILLSEQEGQKEEFDSKANHLIAEGNMTAEDYLEAYHKLKVQQQAALEDEEDSSDLYETQAFQQLSQELTERWKHTARKRENELFLEIKEQANLSEKEAERLMTKYQEQLQDYSNKREMERERQQADIKEKLKERKNRWRREAEQRLLEQDQMVNEQEATLRQVLNTQIGLNEELRKQVMQEHEQNLMALNSHLQISRLRQQKKVEQRLAERRARLADLRKNMEKERANTSTDPDQLKTLARAQNIEYQCEVKKIEEEHQEALEDLRRRLAEETEQALQEQDERLGKILGKLQLEVTRRDEIIRNRNIAIRNLEKKLVDTMTKEGTIADLQTDKILKQHQKQVERLNHNIELERERQMKNIREKIELKQLKRERAMEAKRAKELEELKSKGIKSASGTLQSILTEQQHKRDVEELENEMRFEMRRQVEFLEKEMHHQLVDDLQVEEQDFLAKMAKVSDIPEDELMLAIKSSASEAGMDPKLTKTIAKDVRKRLRSASITESNA